jgi:signal peptidase I
MGASTSPAGHQDPTGPGGTDAEAEPSKPKRKRRTLLRVVTVVALLVVAYSLMLKYVVGSYSVPSESMAPTINTGQHIIIDKLAYRSNPPQPGDVIVIRTPPAWSVGYKSIRSTNAAMRWLQNALSVVGLVPPDENDIVKRVIAVGGQTVECRVSTGLTVDGKPLTEPYLDATTMMADPQIYPCLGSEFGPVTVPDGRLWVMGDNRTHSADSRVHCTNQPADAQRGVVCTGDPMSATIPVANVIGKAKFIAAVNPQSGH